MNDAFLKLPKEKREKILNQAYLEFTEKGFEQASTNQIAKNADIGKGTLFYYFGNKEKLFHYLLEESFKVVNDEYLSKIDYAETDFFERMDQITKLKQTVYAMHYYAFSFLASIMVSVDELHLTSEIQQKREATENVWEEMLIKNIDLSKFREDISAKMSLNLIRWSIEGYRQELEVRFKGEDLADFTPENLQEYYDEYERYIQALKKVYYKKNL